MEKQEEMNHFIKFLIETIESSSELKQKLIDQNVYSTDLDFYKDGRNLSITLNTMQSMIYELKAQSKQFDEVIKANEKIIEENRIKIQKLFN